LKNYLIEFDNNKAFRKEEKKKEAQKDKESYSINEMPIITTK